jgi:hypothetical protein
MLITEFDRRKIANEIFVISNRIAQDAYIERVIQLVKLVQAATGEDISAIIPKKSQGVN